MTFTAPKLLRLLAVPLAFLAAFLALRALAADPPALPARDGGAATARPPADAAARVSFYRAAIRDGARDAATYVALGDALLQRARDTENGAFHGPAEAAFRTALRRDPGSADALAGLGTVALAKHDFAAGLAFGERARRAAPLAVEPLYIVFDAQLELGRYDAAARTLQRAVDAKPTLAAYARVSYLRELRGDLAGAVEAMRLAVSARGPARENVAYVQTLLGDLELRRDRATAAQRAYRAALAALPSHLPAQVGLARTDAARGDLPGAIERYRRIAASAPDPDHIAFLGDAQRAAGRDGAAAATFARARRRQAQVGLPANPDAHVILFEADHGSAARAVALGRRAYAAAPSVTNADALGWALVRAGRAEEGLRRLRTALALGWRDPGLLFHAGMAARAAGEPALARRLLARVVEDAPRFDVLRTRIARRALARLG